MATERYIMKIYMHFGRKNMVGGRVKAARLKSKTTITQQDLAARLSIMGINLDRTAISKIESGERLVTDYELHAFARALGVTYDWLFENGYDCTSY